MNRLRLLALFCGPSINSGVITVILAVVLLGVANFSYFLRSGLLYDLVFGKGTPYDLIQSSKDTASLVNHTVLGNPILNKLLFFGFWVMIGLIVYALISIFSQSIKETEEDVEQMHYMHARKAQIQQDLILRIVLRTMAVLLAFIYGWLFISIIFPFCILASRVGLSNLSHISGVLYLLLSIAVMLTALHAMAIIVRLIVLRPRVFGEWDNLG